MRDYFRRRGYLIEGGGQTRPSVLDRRHSHKGWRRSKRGAAPAPDLLNRDFTADASNERWVVDISEFKCRDGKLYLAGIKDLHDKGLPGWSMGNRQTADLVVAALVMALGRRMPDFGENTEPVHHSGSSSTSRSSTTEAATKPDSATAHRPRSTLPPRQSDSQQPLSRKPGQLQDSFAWLSRRRGRFP